MSLATLIIRTKEADNCGGEAIAIECGPAIEVDLIGPEPDDRNVHDCRFRSFVAQTERRLIDQPNR